MSAPGVRRATRWLAAAASVGSAAGPARAQAIALPGPIPAAWALATGASRDAAGAWVPQLSSAGRVRWAGGRRLGIETAGEGVLLLPAAGEMGGRGIATLRLTASAGRAGAWMGVGGGGRAGGGPARPLLVAEAGGSWGWTAAGLSFSVRHTRMSGVPGTYRDSVVSQGDTTDIRTVRVQLTPGLPERRYTEAELSLAVARGPLRLSALAGARLEERDRRASGWAQGVADLRLGRRAVLSLAGGRLRGVPELDGRQAPFLSLGLRLTPGRSVPAAADAAPPQDAPAVFEVRGEGAVRTLRVIVPHASRVEVKGDFTDWQARVLSPGEEPGTWQVTLPLAPGTYRLNLRVDGGGWGAPPGLPDVEDEFGGRVGLLVIG